jgi:hypothetical protein
MSSTDTSGFGKFVPGFDFLQNLAKTTGGGMGAAPASSAAMPNLSQWLAPSLNVEDIEKRIEELKNVQFWLEQNSRALAATIQALEVQKLTMATLKGMNFTMAETFKPAPAKTKAASAPKPAAEAPSEKLAAGVVDPMQLWTSLTQQFQTIAADTFKEVSAKNAFKPAAFKPAAVKKPAAKKTPTKKAAAKPRSR